MKRLLMVGCFLALNIRGAQPLRVDLNPPEPRRDVLAPGWQGWPWHDSWEASRDFGGIRVTLRTHPSNRVALVWVKGFLDDGVRLGSDGVTVSGPAEPAELDMVLEGLPPGPHSLATWHNDPRSTAPGGFSVWLNGREALGACRISHQVRHDDDIATVWLAFEAEADKPVVVTFRPERNAAGSGQWILNGFALDVPDPSRQASLPFPSAEDEHVEAGPGGSVVLKWRPGRGAMVHHLYLGTNETAVAGAKTGDATYCGRLVKAEYTVAGLTHFAEYFWRVDQEDVDGNVTRGQIWRFRIRHRAFPTAEGYGAFARGGRGGRVIKVTNLNDGGPGSLRAAVEAEGPRTAIFDVGGLITLKSPLVVKHPYLTVAGQTAPGKGICLRGYNFGVFGTHDVIIRYIRVRPGDIAGATVDGMGVASSDHCIVDHCSISWTIDEAFSSRAARNVTLQRTIIAEALNEAGHRKYPPGTRHGYAASIGGMIGSFHHNLLAHCAGRNWSLAGGLNQRGQHTGWLDIRNNVVYNWHHRTTDGGAAKVQFVNNYYKPGPATTWFWILRPERDSVARFGPQEYYVSGNILEGHVRAEQTWGGVRLWPGEPPERYLFGTPFFEPLVQTHSALEAYTNVLTDVGCNFPVLDETDRRIVEEVRTGTARYCGSRTGLPGLPDSQADVGGWEHYPEVHRPPDWDTDSDGMPDDWECRAKLDPRNPVDAQEDRNGDGYTNLEEYLGWLVREFPDPD
ncbi:MAG: T9SS C-terminal target domain-containing protein [Verrucomicrobiota bacterium]|nr:hypothetical protein [Limisphaera sp.]MDW8381870.1 T9SS C-terminal target domain-containing protein [Verrucomicrobiota bacterium]